MLIGIGTYFVFVFKILIGIGTYFVFLRKNEKLCDGVKDDLISSGSDILIKSIP